MAIEWLTDIEERLRWVTPDYRVISAAHYREDVSRLIAAVREYTARAERAEAALRLALEALDCHPRSGQLEWTPIAARLRAEAKRAIRDALSAATQAGQTPVAPNTPSGGPNADGV